MPNMVNGYNKIMSVILNKNMGAVPINVSLLMGAVPISMFPNIL
jgi:hypothetical protein